MQKEKRFILQLKKKVVTERNLTKKLSLGKTLKNQKREKRIKKRGIKGRRNKKQEFIKNKWKSY